MGNTIKAEVLAPAGDFNTFKAVINAGADAVYCGGNMFGARAYAGNFSEEELLAAIDYAHLFGRKVYLTVNTLLKNEEIEKRLYDYLKPYYEVGLDAVIVQDYGVMAFINKYFPEMPVHASTQMTITHRDYCDFLSQYNVTRIVPARELSLKEIRDIHEYAPDMELECFVHGALCYCYSGLCMMSSFYGGRSGNRGRCAGTCRLMYEVDGEQKAILSLKDLCTLNILPDILDAGVLSLKIEGRMKSAEYAAGVTAIYRHYVDMYYDDRENYKVSNKDIDNLLMLFDRGGMTDGYYNRHNGAAMIANDSKTDKSQDAKSAYENSVHDLYVENNIKLSISMKGYFAIGRAAALTVSGDWGTITIEGDTVAASINRPMNEDDIRKQLVKTGNTVFEVAECELKLDDGIFMPNKALNELRRAATSAYEDLCPDRIKRTAEAFDGAYKAVVIDQDKPIRTAKVSDINQAKACVDMEIDRIYLEAESFSDKDLEDTYRICKEKGVTCYLGMPRVLRNDVRIPDYFDGYLVRNIAEKFYLRKLGIAAPIILDYTVYAFNNRAAGALENECDGIFYPIELNEGEMSNLALKNGELTVYGRLPLMVSANCIENSMHRCHHEGVTKSYFTDRKNTRLPYMACCRYCYNVIYNGMVYDIRDKINDKLRVKASAYNYAFTFESAEEVRQILSTYQVDTAYITRGHFKNGVE